MKTTLRRLSSPIIPVIRVCYPVRDYWRHIIQQVIKELIYALEFLLASGTAAHNNSVPALRYRGRSFDKRIHRMLTHFLATDFDDSFAIHKPRIPYSPDVRLERTAVAHVRESYASKILCFTYLVKFPNYRQS